MKGESTGARAARRGVSLLLPLAACLLPGVADAEVKSGKRADPRTVYEAALRNPLISRPTRAGEEERWQEILAARRPSSIVALCDSFRVDFPESPRAVAASRMALSAYRAMRIKTDVGLSEEFFDATHGDAGLESGLRGAARGDAESAFQVARAFADGRSGVPANPYRHDQWLRFAADLGHAEAAWKLSQRYNLVGRVAEAAHYEARARDLGYKAPPRLSNRDY